jgi:hypothetical protein
VIPPWSQKYKEEMNSNKPTFIIVSDQLLEVGDQIFLKYGDTSVEKSIEDELKILKSSGGLRRNILLNKTEIP